MNELISIVDGEIFADSRMIAEHFGKRHSDVLRDISDESEKLGNEAERIFALSEYKDTTGRTLPCYTMNEEGLMQIAARYDAVARRKLIVMVKELKANKPKLPTSYKDALLQLINQIELTEQLELEVSHKENVIIALVEDIDLQTKRQRLNDIMRYKFSDKCKMADKWNLLYKEFDGKYFVNTKLKMDRENVTAKPKYKNRLDYIDRKMNMIPQIYEIACKLFENDVEKLKSEWFNTIK